MGMFDFFKEKIVSSVIEDSLEEIKDEAGKSGIEVNFDGEDDVAEFAVQVSNDVGSQDKEIEMRIGTSLKETFEKTISYAITAAVLDNTELKLEDAEKLGNDDLAEDLEDEIESLEDKLEDIEEDILDDYRNLDESLDLEPVHVQRNHDGDGNLESVEVTVEIENTNNGEELEMVTEIGLDSNRNINKVNIGFDI